ncbi:hypothetical protein [Streptomyces sp.]|uniref:hypothetical protein n=1 Tax=Streptomyces sp. TaxID=1931 RepID=UPI0025DAB67A|nr:hypothetical protein [Streptomyces sp.]
MAASQRAAVSGLPRQSAPVPRETVSPFLARVIRTPRRSTSVAVPCDRFRPAQLAPAVRTAALGLSRALRGVRHPTGPA